jgi:orotidine-5'-phosphate decarboxylase
VREAFLLAIFEFNNKRIIDTKRDLAACHKLQIAYYEAFELKGLYAHKRTLQYIRDLGEIVIADIKKRRYSKNS